MIIGVISDTHGLLRPQALEALAGSDMILHAGDIGAPDILKRLAAIAPVHAVRGNVDTAAWAAKLPARLTITVENHRITMVHALADLRSGNEAATVVVSGHSHKPGFHSDRGILYFNPGSAGPRRFRLPITCGRLLLGSESMKPEIIQLLQ